MNRITRANLLCCAGSTPQVKVQCAQLHHELCITRREHSPSITMSMSHPGPPLIGRVDRSG